MHICICTCTNIFETGSLYVAMAGLELSMGLGWPHSHKGITSQGVPPTPGYRTLYIGF